MDILGITANVTVVCQPFLPEFCKNPALMWCRQRNPG